MAVERGCCRKLEQRCPIHFDRRQDLRPSSVPERGNDLPPEVKEIVESKQEISKLPEVKQGVLQEQPGCSVRTTKKPQIIKTQMKNTQVKNTQCIKISPFVSLSTGEEKH